MKQQILEYLKNNLNSQQFEAATRTKTHSLILAGAGSGKTRTLTHKIAYLIVGEEVKPSNILAVTFTNKAANEMKERVWNIIEQIREQLNNSQTNLINYESEEDLDFDQLVNQTFQSIKSISSPSLDRLLTDFKNLWIWTFHSIFLKILKQDIKHLKKNYNSDFIIYDSDDSQKLIKETIKELHLADKIEPKLAKSIISDWKNRWLLPQAAAYKVENETEEVILKIYEKYQKKLEESNALDFDDLLLLPYTLFKLKPNILEKWHNKFKHILVDEAQDTNWIQFELIKMLSYGKDYFQLFNSDLSSDNLLNQSSDIISKSSIVTFIWDDFQSIYWRRGAVMENFLNVKNWWPDIKIFKLETNYRSLPHIVEAWNAIIKYNKNQYEKQIKPAKTGNATIKVFIRSTEIDEAQWIIDLIKKMKENYQFNRSDFAILYRTNAQSQPFEQILISEWIPYKIWWGFKFFERKEIKDIIAYLRYILNPKDNLSLKRIINTPSRKIWDTTIRKLEEYAAIHNLNLADVIQNIDWIPIKISSTTKLNIKQFITLIKFLKSQLKNQTPAEFIKNLINTIRYKDYLKDLEWEEKAQERLENIWQLINLASNFKTKGEEGLRQFLNEVSLLSEMENQWEEWGDFVKLMTIHASKWLEFPVVFIVGLEENVFPLSRAKLDPQEMEEERRLMYVAITRAQKHLFLSLAKSRQKWWQTQYNQPSRFLEELEKEIPHLLKYFDVSDNNKKSNNTLTASFEEGDIVRHKIFGKGVIVDLWWDVAIVKFFNPKFWNRKIDIRFLEKIE